MSGERTWSLNELAYEVYVWRASKKFYTPHALETEALRDAMLGKLFLVQSEVSEAGEAVRGYEKDPNAALANFKEELADTIIRIMDIVGTMGIDIDAVIKDKMRVNWGRPDRHGKSTSL